MKQKCPPQPEPGGLIGGSANSWEINHTEVDHL